MSSQIPFTPLTAAALARLTPAEQGEFTMAAGQVAASQKPSMMTVVALVEMVQRLITEAAGTDAELAAIRLSARDSGRIVASRPDDGTYAAREISFAAGQSRSLAEIIAAFEHSNHLGSKEAGRG
jgi:hypothetical protein